MKLVAIAGSFILLFAIAYAAGDLFTDKEAYEQKEAIMYTNSHVGDCGGCSNSSNYVTAFDTISGDQLCATDGNHDIGTEYNLDDECNVGATFPSSTVSDYAILGIYPGAEICKGDIGVSDYADCQAQSYDEFAFEIYEATGTPSSSPSSTNSTSSMTQAETFWAYLALTGWIILIAWGTYTILT